MEKGPLKSEIKHCIFRKPGLNPTLTFSTCQIKHLQIDERHYSHTSSAVETLLESRVEVAPGCLDLIQ